jgi:divalent metal cation (Fe/Co/Zn/Cd) transporter
MLLMAVPHRIEPSAVAGACCDSSPPVRGRDGQWLADARKARWLAWASLAWMSAEGAVGLAAGLAAGSVALAGWAAGSVIEALASLIVIWRFTGSRTFSQTGERRAQQAVAASFWLLAVLIVLGAVRDLTGQHGPASSLAGIIVTASSVVVMPALGITKQRLGRRLDSGATAGEGTQNLMCAAQAAAVLAGLAVVAAWPGGWPVDPVIALGIAGWSAWAGWRGWQGAGCC